MRIKGPALALALVLPPVTAQAQQPLSVIDWLNDNPVPDPPGYVLLEPPVADSALRPDVDVSPLDTLLPPVGLVPAAITGLSANLWAGSDSDELIRLIAEVPVQRTPAMQTLLYTLLLSETRPPAGAEEAFLLARLDRLMALGAVDPAQALVQQAGPTRNAARFQRWFDATLLTGDEDQGCLALLAMPHLSSDYAARIFCTVRRGDWPTAALTIESAHALDLLPPDKLDLLDRFLAPELFEGMPPLPVPEDPDPLTFRLFESIGEPLATATLPPAFAAADLRDLAGWKAQLTAAERLARSGALSPNMLLGLYTDRAPAASGGVWDRVAGLQAFEKAMASGDAEAIAETLPELWQRMVRANLEVPVATLFAANLVEVPLDGDATRSLLQRIALLSPDYRALTRRVATDTPEGRFLDGLARGRPDLDLARSPVEQAIVEGFAPGFLLPADLTAEDGGAGLGAAILRAMVLFERGSVGNLADLSTALAAFRAAGLEDTARRAALQVLLLERG